METRAKARLLIVDDERSIREVLTRTLEHEGYQCETAAGADEALELLSDGSFQMVLSDILMPGRTGIELLEDIKRDFPDVAVAMVTAVAETGTAVDALRRGAIDYLTKPFNLEEVLLSVERALRQRNLELANREYRDHLEKKVEEQTDEIRATFMGAIRSLAGALEAKDRYTRGHSDRVTEIAVIMAGRAGLSARQVEQIRLAGTVHDIGKIGVPEAILLKPGRLTEDEYGLVKLHPDRAERILEPIIRDRRVLAVVRHHHERFDGRGYPDGLRGEEIPLGARILAVADTYDAMTSDRPYRDGLTVEQARSQLLANRGSQFDPALIELFTEVENDLHCCPISDSRMAS